jgi:hypothetical protein
LIYPEGMTEPESKDLCGSSVTRRSSKRILKRMAGSVDSCPDVSMRRSGLGKQDHFPATNPVEKTSRVLRLRLGEAQGKEKARRSPALGMTGFFV